MKKIEQADLVITGEGRLDNESFDGKVVGGVASKWRARFGHQLVVIAGASVDPALLPISEHASVTSLTERFGLEQALASPARCTQTVVDELLSDST